MERGGGGEGGKGKCKMNDGEGKVEGGMEGMNTERERRKSKRYDLEKERGRRYWKKKVHRGWKEKRRGEEREKIGERSEGKERKLVEK